LSGSRIREAVPPEEDVRVWPVPDSDMTLTLPTATVGKTPTQKYHRGKTDSLESQPHIENKYKEPHQEW
jgi:hypothetical protein